MTRKIHFKIQGPLAIEALKERDALFRKIGELEMHRDFKKKLTESRSMKEH